MPSVNYVLIYCASCGERRKIAPEKFMEPRKLGELEWSQPRALACPIPTCTGTMRRAPEYQEPMYCGQAFWPVNADAEWMA